MKMSIDEIVKEVRKNINKSFVENRHLLNEKWSYSSDVEEEEAEINNEELATGIMSLIASFRGKFYERRSAERRR